MKIQHLVLDDDVHKALKARKKKVGVTVKEIGNSALRAALAVPTKEELVVAKLVETGKISHKDYDQAVTAADKEAKLLRKKAIESAVQGPSPQTWTLGSWTINEVYRSPDGQLQVGDLRARDVKKSSTPVMVHEYSHVWVTVLSGRMHLKIDGEEKILGPNDSVHIPEGTPHVTIPLTKTTRVILLATPAIDLAGSGSG